MTEYVSRRITLLRHGQVSGPAALYGRSDPDLSHVGWQSFKDLHEHQFGWGCIISSPRSRCQSLARKLSNKAVIPLEVWPELAEMDFGDLDGIPFDNLTHFWTQLEQFWASPGESHLPGAEPLTLFHDRIILAWQQLLIKSQQQDLLVITHGGVIRMIIAELLGANWRSGLYHQRLVIPHASATELTVWHTSSAQAEPSVQIRQLAHPIHGIL